MLADRLLFGPSERVACGGVPVQDGADVVVGDDGLSCGAQEARLEVHRLLGPPPVGDVAEVADHHTDGRVIDQVRRDLLDPTDVTLGVEDAELGADVIAHPGDRRELRDDAGPVEWMDLLHAVLSDQLGRLDAEQTPRRRARPGDRAIRFEEHHQIARAGDDGIALRMFRLELEGDVVALGDVSDVEHQSADRRVGQVVHHRHLAPAVRPIRMDGADHHGPGGGIGVQDRGRQDRTQTGEVVGVGEERTGVTDDLVDGVPEDRLDRLARVGDDTLGVDDQDDLGGAVEQHRQSAFRQAGACALHGIPDRPLERVRRQLVGAQVVLGSDADRVARHRVVLAACEHDDRRAGDVVEDDLQPIQVAGAVQPELEEHAVEVHPVQHRERLGHGDSVARGDSAIGSLRERITEPLRGLAVVLDDQHVRRRARQRGLVGRRSDRREPGSFRGHGRLATVRAVGSADVEIGTACMDGPPWWRSPETNLPTDSRPPRRTLEERRTFSPGGRGLLPNHRGQRPR